MAARLRLCVGLIVLSAAAGLLLLHSQQLQLQAHPDLTAGRRHGHDDATSTRAALLQGFTAGRTAPPDLSKTDLPQHSSSSLTTRPAMDDDRLAVFGYSSSESADITLTGTLTASRAARTEAALRLVATAVAQARADAIFSQIDGQDRLPAEQVPLPDFDVPAAGPATRAAVFFYDAPANGKVDLTQLQWWLFTWRALRLDRPGRDALDLIVFCVPVACRALPPDCRPHSHAFPNRSVFHQL